MKAKSQIFFVDFKMSKEKLKWESEKKNLSFKRS